MMIVKLTLVCVKMSRRVQVIISSSAPQDQNEPPLQITESKPGEHPGVKGFLMIKPAILGVNTCALTDHISAESI